MSLVKSGPHQKVHQRNPSLGGQPRDGITVGRVRSRGVGEHIAVGEPTHVRPNSCRGDPPRPIVAVGVERHLLPAHAPPATRGGGCCPVHARGAGRLRPRSRRGSSNRGETEWQPRPGAPRRRHVPLSPRACWCGSGFPVSPDPVRPGLRSPAYSRLPGSLRPFLGSDSPTMPRGIDASGAAMPLPAGGGGGGGQCNEESTESTGGARRPNPAPLCSGHRMDAVPASHGRQ
eukprot:gene6566-biopygen4541